MMRLITQGNRRKPERTYGGFVLRVLAEIFSVSARGAEGAFDGGRCAAGALGGTPDRFSSCAGAAGFAEATGLEEVALGYVDIQRSGQNLASGIYLLG